MNNGWGRKEIIDASLDIIDTYSGVPITVRQLHYRLVSQGMPNNIQQYKRVVAAMTKARWAGTVDMEAFVDRDREVVGETKAEETDLGYEIERGKQQVEAWMKAYRLNKWENQPNYIEVWIEKKALQGVCEGPCLAWDVALCPCKGYPSLTYLNEGHDRFDEARGRDQRITILYFGDYDPSGVDIPRSLWANIERMGSDIDVKVIALNPDQINEMRLPPAPVKKTDTRAKGWTGGVVELDAVEPRELQRIVREAIKQYFNPRLEDELRDREYEERQKYQNALLTHVKKIVE